MMTDHDNQHEQGGGRGRFQIEPDDSMPAAAACVIARNERRLRKHTDRISHTDDPEEVHDARVAARRIRSAFDVFDGDLPRKEIKGFRRELRRAGRALAIVRDLDVLVARLAAYRNGGEHDAGSAEAKAAAGDGLEPLVDAWTAERKRAIEDARDEAASRRYRRSIRDLRDFATDQIAHERRVSAGERDRRRVDPPVPVRLGAASRVLRAYEGLAAFRIDPLTAEVDTLHRLRIAGKRLRYAIEAFEDVLPPEAMALRDEVVALQDDAGKLHDDVVAARRARQFIARSLREGVDGTGAGSQSADRTAAAIEQFALSLDDDVNRLRQSLAERLPRVNGPDFRSRLCSVVATG